MLGEAIRGQRLDPDQFAEYRSRPDPRDGMTDGKAPLVDKVRLLNLPIKKIFDPTERQGLFDQLDQRFVVDLPMIALLSSYSLTLHHKKVKGYQPWAAGTPRYWGVSIE
jgi:peptide/nickel transport system substrate-binding protein